MSGWDAEEAKRRIARMRQHGDLPGNQLADQLEAAGVEIERLMRELAISKSAHAATIAFRDADTADRNSLRQQLEAKTSELAFADRSLTAVQEQLEVARKAHAREIHDHSDDYVRLLAQYEGQKADLAAAQQRIAELEAEVDANRDMREALVNHGALTALVDGNGALAGVAYGPPCIPTLGGIVNPGASLCRAELLTAALRAIAPVHRAAEMLLKAWDSPDKPHHRLQMALQITLTSARARLTPELLAVIEAAGR